MDLHATLAGQRAAFMAELPVSRRHPARTG